MGDVRERNMAHAGTRVRAAAGEGDAQGFQVLERDFPKKPTGWPYHNPFDYMAGKRADDGVPPHLWRIHDSYYDLKDFKHPGGEQRHSTRARARKQTIESAVAVH